MAIQIESAYELIKAIADILDRQKVRYFVTGGFAVSVWGRVRATQDIDLGVTFPAEAIPGLVQSFKQLSSGVYMDQDQMAEALERHGEFNFIEPNAGLKVDFWIVRDDDFTKSTFKRIRNVLVGEKRLSFISPEDLILSKLLWWRETQSMRDIEDAQSVMVIQKKLDWRYLERWAKQLKVFSKLKEVKQLT